MAKAYNDRAADEATEIKKLNRSIFRPSFTLDKQAKRDASERRIMDRHETERSEREEVRRQVADSRDRIGGTFREMEKPTSKGKPKYGAPGAGNRFAERSRYQFEADDEDNELENELDENLTEISDFSKRLNLLAKSAGEEINSQNRKLTQLHDKTDNLDMKLFQVSGIVSLRSRKSVLTLHSQNTQRLQRIVSI